MPRQPRQLAETGIYHVMLRGVNRDAIFLEDEDYARFLSALTLVRRDSGCRVLAYCLMTNHAHLVLRTTHEPIGQVVKRLGVRYAGWFNRKYGRVGHVFQDRFASRPVTDDAYLATLLRYVWRNPVDAGLATEPEAYPWSSRHILGTPSLLVDEQDLHRLLPPGWLQQIVHGEPAVPGADDPLGGAPPRHTDREVANVIRSECGVGVPEGFGRLDAASRRSAIRILRTRSVPYAQIARVTGTPISTVRRLHLSTDDAAITD